MSTANGRRAPRSPEGIMDPDLRLADARWAQRDLLEAAIDRAPMEPEQFVLNKTSK